MAFPTTSVLDNFNRADAATSLGASWTTGGASTGWTSLGVAGNRLYSSTSTFAGNYWNTSYGTSMEIFATIPVLPGTGGNIRFWLRMQNPGLNTCNCYSLHIAPNGNCAVYRTVAASNTYLFENNAANITAGTQVGLSHDGSTLAFYINGVQDNAVSESAVIGSGQLGVGFVSDTTGRVDDFGGGNIVAGASLAPVNVLTLGVG